MARTKKEVTAKKKGKIEMGLKEATTEAKKKGKMEMGLPQRLRKRKNERMRLVEARATPAGFNRRCRQTPFKF